jgi:hypothetical protein
MGFAGYIHKLFVIFRHARVEILFWAMVTMPVWAADGSYSNEFAIGGILVFLIIVAALYRIMRKERGSSLIEVGQMYAHLMLGRLRVLVANLDELTEDISFRLTYDHHGVLEQFDRLFYVQDVHWQEGLLALAESSGLGKGDKGKIMRGLGMSQQLLMLRSEVTHCTDENRSQLAQRIVLLGGGAAGLFREAAANLQI